MSTRWLAETLDEAFIRVAIRPTLPFIDSSSPLTRLRLAEERTQLELDELSLFPDPARPEVRSVHSRASRSGIKIESRTWTGVAVPLETQWERGSIAPRVVHTELYARSPERPLLVAIGGWMPVHAISTRLLWPLAQLDALGFDVVVPQISARAKPPRVAFPGADPCRNIIETAHRVAALRQTLAHATELGYEKIVVWGASLGAYIAGLLGTLAPFVIDELVLEKPLARLSDPLRLHGRGRDVDRRSVALRLNRVYRAVSPLERQPRVPSGKVHVIGARHDRVTTFESAEQIAAHFKCSFEPVDASHFYDLDRKLHFATCLSRLRLRG
jgi:pimeloyl-ACP methyl ester carboxylesterase